MRSEEVYWPFLDLASAVLRYAVSELGGVLPAVEDLPACPVELEAEDVEGLALWFRAEDQGHPFGFAAICLLAGADPRAVLARLPVVDRAMARRYTSDYLRAQRARLGLTQAQLAARLDITQQAVQAWEQGKRPVPTRLVGLMEALFFPPTACRGCGTNLARLASGGLVCPACSAREEDDDYCRGLDRGKSAGAIFRRR